MARSHLTLAALATSAVPGLDIAASTPFGGNRAGASQGSDFDAAILTGRDGRHWIIRAPRNAKAESEQSADLVALRALSAGVRTRLPFSVSTFAGQVPIDSTRAIVYEFVYGAKVPFGSYDAGPDSLAASVGSSIAAIHSLPTSFVTDAGLPTLTAGECLRSCVTVMDRASATGLMPAALLGRWERATEDAKLWQFQPTVINGALSADSFLSADGAVTGVLGWQELRVADPARDLQWILGSPVDGVIESTFDAYARVRGSGDRQVRQRAMLYAELEVAKWLLHGTETRSTEIVDDALAMLSGLVENVRNDVMNPIGAQTMPTMAVDEVEAFLARSQRAV
ncbi:MAG: macrolide 2-phosphotransferase [Rhodoglobus sp.]|nr:macrolide 2-phosphotransferase [Rhodoglobus sp.]